MDELAYETERNLFSKRIEIKYSLKDKPSMFRSLHELLQLPKPELESKLGALKRNRLDYYYVNTPAIRRNFEFEGGENLTEIADYGRERLVITKTVDGRTIYLEIRNWGLGTKNTNGELIASIVDPSDIDLVNIMLNNLFLVFDTNDKDKTINKLKDELGDNFAFRLS
ncbi:hypothetical protein A2954_00885 [Candidatus Roizmanbacteria bacterium RIFCSPLOWO2_01_FULL_37_12]|uniref:CYTH domain-containing protein n=1 Tax=Candidatus Roizmanbacteria bacterium RIFCSPLOWO2_01_FULL_37_12 TaxID=1802056 RepID=A0A1F7IG93_9BACT|nr:MAG: hypothetical protein A3D76_06885 [Candidatus Roizmanbacteria bacterium RIFCSPHIGHO2_02_FULL_37_9b]OGK42383.1 MAG: hypothetical protein A2954_00885 [Candidatus Roizmanbacteria bacterium RIFCSPLOWO2_01_FULL_37_12]